MHIELVSNLRCTRKHEDTWLVARADEMVGRHIVSGLLGCPVCGAEYSIAGGVAKMGDSAEHDGNSASQLPEDAPLRLAALLGLDQPGGVVVLSGEWTRVALQLADLAQTVAIMAVAAEAPAEPDDRVSYFTSGEELPLRPASVRGIALGRGQVGATALRLRSAATALQPGGRVVAPAALTLPEELRELGRDDRDWVAEKSSPQPVVSLGRRGIPR